MSNKMQKKFRSQDGEVFEVREVSQVDNEPWVYYNKVGAEHEYSCLLEAFRERFTLQEES
jgi:hypothetical protein